MVYKLSVHNKDIALLKERISLTLHPQGSKRSIALIDKHHVRIWQQRVHMIEANHVRLLFNSMIHYSSTLLQSNILFYHSCSLHMQCTKYIKIASQCGAHSGSLQLIV